MVVNQHHTPSYLEDRIYVPNQHYRVPVISIPQPPTTIDLRFEVSSPMKKKKKKKKKKAETAVM